MRRGAAALVLDQPYYARQLDGAAVQLWCLSAAFRSSISASLLEDGGRLGLVRRATECGPGARSW